LIRYFVILFLDKFDDFFLYDLLID